MTHSDAMLSEFESHIEAYESQLAAGSAASLNLRDYLPPSSSEAVRARVLVELLRITLEHQWSRGDRSAIDRFRHDYPDVFAQSDVLGPLAFEEYRLRIQAGESVTPSDFAMRYGVDVAAWPELEPEEERWRSFSRDAPEDAGRLEKACRLLPNVGEAFEGFTLLSELGRGAFARVFLARQESLAGRLVALKVTAGPTVEPRRMARLQHGNIVPIYSVHTRDSLTGVCMPFLGCATLADVVRSVWHSGRSRTAAPASGRSIVSTLAARRSIVSTFAGETTVQLELPADSTPSSETPGARLLEQIESESYVSAVVRLASHVAEGLAHAHIRGIVHRDLKPANILLADDGEPLILDFNLSEELGPAASGVALVGGTLPYMSPEQLEALRAERRADCPTVDSRSDLFSLGVVLYELLTGRLPRELTRGSVDSIAAALRRAWNEPLRSPREWNPSVTPGLAAIVTKCLEPSPERRYAQARDLAEDLDRHLTHRPLRYAPNGSLRERLTKWSRRHPRLSSATGVGLTAATLVGLLIGAWAARGVQLERADAAAQRRAFLDELPQARVRLAPGVQTLEPAIAQRGVEHARRLLDQYQFTTNARWREQPAVRRLNADERTQLAHDLAELAGLLAVVEATNEATDEAQPVAGRVESPLATAMALCRERRYAEAAGRLQAIVLRDPRDAAAWLALGYCHVRLNDLSQAEIDYSMCRALSPQLHVGVYFRGLARLEMKRHAAAYDDFTETLQLAPETPEAYFHRGLAAQALQKHAEAIADFDRALERGFRHTRVYFLRARSHAALGEAEAAGRDRQRGMEETPSDSLSYVARALERLGRDAAGARADLEAALEQDPDCAVARANLAHVLSERLKESEAALDCLDQWIKTYPKDALAWGSRAVLHGRAGRTDEALRDAEEALRWSQAPFTRYQAACAIALVARGEATRLERTRTLIAQALDEEPALALDMRHDPDLAALRSDMRFARLIGAALVLVEESKVEHGK